MSSAVVGRPVREKLESGVASPEKSFRYRIGSVSEGFSTIGASIRGFDGMDISSWIDGKGETDG